MKATKRIFAVVMIVMMLALMIPFSASAAGSYTATITAKEGYTVTLYKIGTLNSDGTLYTAVNGVAPGIKNAVEATPIEPQTLLNAAEAAKKAGQNTGAEIDEKTAGATGVVTFTTDEAGLYYATITGTPAGTNVKKTGGSIFYLSDAKNASGAAMTTATVDISGKIEDGTVNVKKEIVDYDISNAQTTAMVGEEVTFKLTASITGTKDEYLKSYVIHDSMSDGLDYVKVDSVYVDEIKLNAADYTVTATDKTDIRIALSEDYLDAAKAGTNDFYASSNVIVNIVGKLNANAVKGRTTDDDKTAYANTVANYNKDSLEYTNKYNDTSTTEGNTVHVYTFDVDIYKVDATNDAKLDGATFTLTKGSYTFEATTANGGKATFAGLEKGTYTLKEKVAPNGYNLNTTEYTVTIGDNGTITSAQYDATLKGVKIGDTPVVMPATGGNGTMIFTIVGASLIACAGILFIILKKRAASK
ncbi:SpaA isopeptide-forming pilin-related protein [Ruminococcus sp.]|uniref:SpaA isopeptide-forming pilin-related protein n=1 Tax=Ruminococcus sp. TaxID=41978 RepID=UPI00386F7AC3